jgi:adenine-specific DNA-methyltransferase
MYMCRETICKAVIQKLNDSQNWNCNNFNELKEDITNFIKTHPEGRKFARKITNNKINEIKICDPAVGSGHFLVSALNEMIAVKAALGVLVDRDYEPINQYELRVENDELITTDLDNNLFQYNPTNKESQRIQEALFHEKQTIIENCLFGVDINPNSVQICRLRLWIELLKNAYYKVPPNPVNSGNFVPFRELETLPNIDINIKCGNSLISKFDLHEKYNINSEKGKIIDEYKSIVAKYKNSLSPVDKNQIRERIKNIKNTFIEEFNANSLWVKKLNRRELELAKRERQIIEEETKIKLLGKDFEAEANKNIKNLKANIQVINKEIKEIKLEIEQEKNQEIYRKAFEWRFEFPEVLDENGNFTGFDMVIGNPPYIRADIDSLEYQQFRKYIESGYETVYEKWDIIIPFYERAMKLLKSGGHNCFIVSESIASSKYTFKLQDWLIKNYKIYKLNYFENIEVFKGVGVVPLISHIHKIGCNKYEIEKIIHNTNFAELNITRIFIDKDTDRAIVFKKKFKRFDTQVESELLGNICYISVGMVINADEKKIKGEFVKDDLLSDVKDKIHPKQIVEGKDLKAYLIERKKYFEWGTDRVPAKLRRATFPELYEGEKILRGRVTKGTFDNTGILCNDGVMVLKKFIDLKKVHNNSIESSITRNNNKTRKQLEDISQDYNLKYILAILNSKFAMNFLNNVRRHRLLNYFYPDDLRKLPIPKISQKEQKPFIDLVEKILSLKEQNKDTKKLEEKIDKLVYKLYELTEEEIKIIEESK